MKIIRNMLILLSVILATLLLAGWSVYSSGLIGSMAGDFQSSSECFEATFGSPPSSTISDLKAEGNEFRDSGFAYLRFRTSRPVLMGMLGKDFHPISRIEFAEDINGTTGFPPSWWTPTVSSSATFMQSQSFHPSFESGRAYLSYDAKTQTAFLYWDGDD